MIRTRFALILLVMMLLAMFATTALAQTAPSNSTPEAAKLAPVTNPVSAAVKAQLPRFSKNMVAAAEAMPADKFNFKPTPEMNSFAHLVMHIAQSNNGLCSKISDTPAPEAKLADTDPKDKLVAGLKASFDYCASALEKVDDSKLGDQMILFGNRPFSRAAVLIILSDDWYDHYGAQATYLRLNGILPPTAQPAPK
ncbi:MAG TPA: DinB family protein [Candidatus Acidoferrum sp.]